MCRCVRAESTTRVATASSLIVEAVAEAAARSAQIGLG